MLQKIKKSDIHNFIKILDYFSKKDKNTILELTSAKYIGYAPKIIEQL